MLAATLAASLLIASQAASQAPARLGIGRAATAEEVRAIDIDVMPDGRGLPPGQGTVADGAATYKTKCASCHGGKGEGGTAERLVGRDMGKNFDFATDARLPKTIGSYWPYATTLYDYTSRSMPFTQPGTLTANETYGLVAYLLFLNQIVDQEAIMNAQTLPDVKMPARSRFVPDQRKGGAARVLKK